MRVLPGKLICVPTLNRKARLGRTRLAEAIVFTQRRNHTTAAVGMRATPTRMNADTTAAGDVATLTIASNVDRKPFADSQPDIPVREL